MSELSELRHRLVEARKSSGRTLARALRLEVGSAAIRLKDEQGLSRQRLAEQLGMSKATLNSWVDLARAQSVSTNKTKVSPAKKKQAPLRILPVEVEADIKPPQSKAISVRLPSGAIVAGLSIVDIAELERALS